MFNGFSDLVEPNLFAVTYQALTDAVDEGYGKIEYGKPDYAFAQQLKKSGAWFSARKSFRQSQDLAALLTDENGKTRTWRQFQTAAKGVIQDYNQTWLQTEYHTAIASARNVKLWQQWEADADLYPNLKYLPSRAATPRDEHKPYYGVIRPIMDEFWLHHLPPIDYNCKCGVEQSDEDETPVPQKAPKPAPGLDNNPAKTGTLFSDSHPYSADLDEKKRKELDDEGENLMNDGQ